MVKQNTLSFEIESEKAFTAQVFYTKKAGDKFNEKQSVKKEVKAGKSFIKIALPTKRLYNFHFDFGVNPGKVSIKNLTITGKKKYPLNFNDFSWNQINDRDISKSSATISSNESDPYMVYKPVLNVKGANNIDWCLFLILLCSYWFVSSKGIGYLAKFKIFEKHSRIDIVFLSVFFILLFIPMLHISNEKKSGQENRLLAVLPPLISNGDLNNEFGLKFNDWFNDRFFGRPIVIKIEAILKQFLNRMYCGPVYCLINRDFIKQKRKAYAPDSIELENDKQALQTLSSFCQKNKIQCYFLALPARELFLPDSNSLPQPYPTHTSLLAENLPQDSLLIDVTQQFITANKQEPVFFKTDHHWTEWGAWVAYQVIAERLKNETPFTLSTDEAFYNIHYNKLVRAEYKREFTYGSLCDQMNLSWTCPLSYKYKYFDLPKGTKITRKDRFNTVFSKFTNPDAPYDNIVIIGNSMAENIIHFFAPNFKHVHKFRANNAYEKNLNMSRWEKDILKIKPQVLLFVVGSDFLNHLQNMWKEN